MAKWKHLKPFWRNIWVANEKRICAKRREKKKRFRSKLIFFFAEHHGKLNQFFSVFIRALYLVHLLVQPSIFFEVWTIDKFAVPSIFHIYIWTGNRIYSCEHLFTKLCSNGIPCDGWVIIVLPNMEGVRHREYGERERVSTEHTYTQVTIDSMISTEWLYSTLKHRRLCHWIRVSIACGKNIYSFIEVRECFV